MAEKKLGTAWAAAKRRAGCAVYKIHAAGLTGIPDWLVFNLPAGRIQLWEAKEARSGGRSAYGPRDLRSGQHWFQRLLSRLVDAGGVVLLDDDGFVELSNGEQLRALPRREYERLRRGYK